MSEVDDLKIEIAGLKKELKDALSERKTYKSKRRESPEANTDYEDAKAEVIRISKQLEQAQAKELFLLQANSDAGKEQSSQAGTSLFVFVLSVAPHGIHVLYVFFCVDRVFCCLYRASTCSNSVLVLVWCSV
jgi:hypothetical protein